MAATTTRAATVEQRIVLDNISWEAYEHLLAEFADRRSPRLTYDRGMLEIVSPTPQHEEDHLALAAVVAVVAEELGIDFRPVGSTTYRRRELLQGFEADSSFYITNERFARDNAVIDPQSAPPPDLVIEADVTHATLDKRSVYAGFGVPEVWRSRLGLVSIHRLDGHEYREFPESAVLPPLTSGVLTRFLAESRRQRRLAWLREVRAWARAGPDSEKAN